jgi:phosphate-selective porin
VTIQGGYFVMEDVEAFARYEYMDFDLQNQINPKTARFSGFTLGSNWFLTPAVKLTADWTYNFDSLAAGGFQSNGIGLRPDRSGEVGQWALRGQLQLLF